MILDRHYNVAEGVIKFSPEPAESLKHFLAKCLVCWEYKNNGLQYYTECRFTGDKRADIFVPINNESIEIVHSESNKSVLLKVNEYPTKVIFLTSDEVLRQWGVVINARKCK